MAVADPARGKPGPVLLDRLLGLETEYAIRYTAQGTEPRPDHQLVHDALSAAIATLVPSSAGQRRSHGQRFVANGGAFYYEFVPSAPAGGVIEASTPECRGPSQLLLYQKAQERLLLMALPLAEQSLARHGYPGALGISISEDMAGDMAKIREEIGRRIDEHAERLGLIVRPLINMCVLSPPLIITRSQIDEIVEILRKSILLAMDDVRREGLWQG